MKKNNNTEKVVLNAKNISEALKKGTEQSIQALLNEAISNIIKESDDEDEEDKDDAEDLEDASSEKGTATSEADEESEEEKTDSDTEEVINDEDDEEWSDFDDLKVGDDEYDATEEDDDTALRIYNKLDDDDEIVVTPDDEGTYEFSIEDGGDYVLDLGDDLDTMDDTESEFDIDLGDEAEDESEDLDIDGDLDDEAEGEGEDLDFELDLDDEDEDEGEDFDIEVDLDDEDEDEDEDFDIEVDLDDEAEDELDEEKQEWTNAYQKNVMPGLNVNEPANAKATYSMDGGVPTGNGRPYGRVGDGDPFGNANEATNIGGQSQHRSSSKNYIPSGRRDYTQTRNASAAGEKINEAIKQLRSLKNENKQYRKALDSIKKSLKEAAVLNVTLGQVVKILCENSTTKSEKQSIVERFSNVKSITECKSLYNRISKELNENKKPMLTIEKTFTAEPSKVLNETTIYNKVEDNPSLDLMNRMNNLWK